MVRESFEGVVEDGEVAGVVEDLVPVRMMASDDGRR